MWEASSQTRAERPGSGGGETKPPEVRIRSCSPGESGFWSMERGMVMRLLGVTGGWFDAVAIVDGFEFLLLLLFFLLLLPFLAVGL